jgi:hypothetical protein
MERFPQFRLDDNVRGVYQEDAGLVDAGRANATHVSLARNWGATILDNTPVRTIRVVGDGVEVVTGRGTFSGRRLVVAAGAWTNRVLRHVGVELPITCTQEQVTYFRAPRLEEFSLKRFPIWIWHGGLEETFYGLPVYGAPGIKAGQDVGGDVVTVDTRTFEPNPRILANLRRFLERYIPGSLGPELYTKTCLYGYVAGTSASLCLQRRGPRFQVREPRRQDRERASDPRQIAVPYRTVPPGSPGAYRPDLRTRVRDVTSVRETTAEAACQHPHTIHPGGYPSATARCPWTVPRRRGRGSGSSASRRVLYAVRCMRPAENTPNHRKGRNPVLGDPDPMLARSVASLT